MKPVENHIGNDLFEAWNLVGSLIYKQYPNIWIQVLHETYKKINDPTLNLIYDQLETLIL